VHTIGYIRLPAALVAYETQVMFSFLDFGRLVLVTDRQIGDINGTTIDLAPLMPNRSETF